MVIKRDLERLCVELFELNAIFKFKNFKINDYLARKIISSKYENSNLLDNKLVSKIGIPVKNSNYSKLFNLKIPKISTLLVISHFIINLTFKKSRKEKSIKNVYGFSLTSEQINFKNLKQLEYFLTVKLNLESNSRIYIQTKEPWRSRGTKNLKLTPFNPTSIILNSGVSRRKILVSFFFSVLKLYKNLNKYPVLELLGIENLIEAIALEFDCVTSSDILFTTQSQLLIQPPIFTTSTSNKLMLWYSENSRPIIKKHLPTQSNSFLDFLTIANIDKHLVWTEQYAQYLKDNYQVNAKAIGSMVFYLNNERVKKNTQNLLIFDVTPINHSTELNFYSEKALMEFLADIVKANSEISVPYDLQIKPKRKYQKIHSHLYINFVQNLIKNNNLKMLETNANLYDIIRDAKGVICIPYTSPALIANELNTPVIYYYPNSNFDMYEDLNNITLITNQHSLKSWLNANS